MQVDWPVRRGDRLAVEVRRPQNLICQPQSNGFTLNVVADDFHEGLVISQEMQPANESLAVSEDIYHLTKP